MRGTWHDTAFNSSKVVCCKACIVHMLKIHDSYTAFKPQGGWHVGKSLIDSHMEAHKQRVESAKGTLVSLSIIA